MPYGDQYVHQETTHVDKTLIQSCLDANKVVTSLKQRDIWGKDFSYNDAVENRKNGTVNYNGIEKEDIFQLPYARIFKTFLK